MCGVYVVLLFHVPGSRPFVYLYSSFSCIPQHSELAHLARPKLVLWAVLLVTEFSSLPRNRRPGFSCLLRLFPQCGKLIIYSVLYMFSFFKGSFSCRMFSSGTGFPEGHELQASRSVRRAQSRSRSASSRTCGGTLRRGCARRQPRTDRGGHTVSKSNTDRQGRRWLGVCSCLAVRSDTCRQELSDDSQGGRSVQGRRAGAIR